MKKDVFTDKEYGMTKRLSEYSESQLLCALERLPRLVEFVKIDFVPLDSTIDWPSVINVYEITRVEIIKELQSRQNVRANNLKPAGECPQADCIQ